jgi:HD-GYP domain-containing protein (c-di-GMP phosphodiesterase class II)
VQKDGQDVTKGASMSKEVIDSLRTLHDLSKAINSTLDIEEVVAMLMEKTSRLMRSDRVLLLLLDRQKRGLTVHSTYGFEEGELRVKRFRNVEPFDHCIVHKGTVITLKEIVPEDDYSELVYDMPFLADMVFAPLEVRGEAYGLIGVMGGKRSFTRVEIEIFCALGSQSAVAMENANLYGRLKNAFLHTAESLAEAVNSRDPYTGGHTRRVAEYSLLIAEGLGLSDEEKEMLKFSSILHDIGKIGIDDAILRKGGVLTEEEALKMREHPAIGARILGMVEEMKDVIPGVFLHHEWFDGSGYPKGLKGEEIPLQARIIAIADAYDALTTDRPYRKALDKNSAFEEVAGGSGAQFDSSLVEIFRRILIEDNETGI